MSDLEQRLAKRKTKTFTSSKLDLMNGVNFDQRVDYYAKSVFNALIWCLNQNDGRCFPSDDLIVEMVGGSRRSVFRARLKLRKCGYLDWRKTGRCNQYFFNPAAAAPSLAALKRKLEKRREYREMLRRELDEMLLADAPPMTQRDVPSVTH